MKVPLNWLKDYVDINLPADEVADKLTMAGVEVSRMQVIGGDWEKVVVGQIVAINPHPNADRLTLPTVDLGAEQLTVVCGAPNLKVGDKVAFAYVGARLIDGYSGKVTTLKSAKIRGVNSSGMICSEKELSISDSHEGIMVLPPEAQTGMPLADYLGDVILDLDVTPNRPDCLSVIGIAREVATLTGQSVSLAEVSYEETGALIDQQVSVEINDPYLCPRYCASLITGVKIAESPHWLQQRLLACGLRPISNIVDITNYVMLEYGQPLHSFDYDEIRGKKIIVRQAEEGEHLVTLDGVERVLSADMLVIADSEGALALAGVMGGSDSEVTSGTTSILLEGASFNPASIHYTGRRLQMPSEACMRFERGIHSELAMPALKRATQLMLQLGGGRVAKGIIDVYPGKQTQEPIRLSTDRVKTLLGTEFSLDQIMGTLTTLGFNCQPGESTSEVHATAPYWRSDIHLAEDLVEEVARIIGYDKIPINMLSQPIPRQNPDPILNLKQRAEQILVGCGFQEVIAFSLTSIEMLNKLLPKPHPLEPKPLRMANPMSTEREYLRPNLRANLLVSFATNRRHEDGGIRLFELGRVYLYRSGDLPDEPEILCGIMGGLWSEKSWQGKDKLCDFYDAKGIVDSLLIQLGVVAGFTEGRDESLRPGRQASVIVAGNRLGVVGELHPKVLTAFQIIEPVYLFEVNLSELLTHAVGHKMFKPVPRFPAMVRDIALVVDAGISHQQVLDVITGFPLVSRVVLFDVYAGDQVPPGKKSLAYSITFQSPAHTLTEAEVDRVQQQILDRLSAELGAVLRS